jgi:RsiW-degrading membrane proteinase PrsW (M82 family)
MSSTEPNQSPSPSRPPLDEATRQELLAFWRRAESHTERGEWTEARQAYRSALILDPGEASLYNDLGTVHEELGDAEAAEQAYRQAIALEPGYATAYFNLGMLLKEQERLNEASEAFEACIERSEDVEERTEARIELDELDRIRDKDPARLPADDVSASDGVPSRTGGGWRVWEQVLRGCGCLLLILALPTIACGGLAWLGLMSGGDVGDFEFNVDGWILGAFWFSMVLLTLGGGLVLLLQGQRSLRDRPSGPLRLPRLRVLVVAFVLVLLAGEALRQGLGDPGMLFFPPFFVAAAALPPLAAYVWASPDSAVHHLTWRQFTVAFLLGATISVILAIWLEVNVAMPFVVLVVQALELTRDLWEALLRGLGGGEVTEMVTSPDFVAAALQVTFSAPIVEEFTKPLVTLPLIRRAGGPRQAFFIGAAAGVGFAVLENVFYSVVEIPFWSEIVLLRMMSAALHPLGAGLVALGWYYLLRVPVGDRTVAQRQLRAWLPRFVLAVVLHMIWNGGSTLILALMGIPLLGSSTSALDVLGTPQAMLLLVILATVGLAAAVVMRLVVRSIGGEDDEGGAGALGEPVALAPDTALDVLVE